MLWKRSILPVWLVTAPGTGLPLLANPEATNEPTCLIVDSM
ncbi:rCG30380, isoform CRA_b [Rattus norvegicus]|uniref:RCG30380, isoform CRA_b n=1 Tax=Rattus norvegicus TaxID=10116 RepID=A6JFN6_RAT|nr:rCG30380, isoform CRA_b [Rattus norvegicus]